MTFGKVLDSGKLKVTNVLRFFMSRCLEVKFNFFFFIPHVALGHVGGPHRKGSSLPKIYGKTFSV